MIVDKIYFLPPPIPYTIAPALIKDEAGNCFFLKNENNIINEFRKIDIIPDDCISLDTAIDIKVGDAPIYLFITGDSFFTDRKQGVNFVVGNIYELLPVCMELLHPGMDDETGLQLASAFCISGKAYDYIKALSRSFRKINREYSVVDMYIDQDDFLVQDEVEPDHENMEAAFDYIMYIIDYFHNNKSLPDQVTDFVLCDGEFVYIHDIKVPLSSLKKYIDATRDTKRRTILAYIVARNMELGRAESPAAYEFMKQITTMENALDSDLSRRFYEAKSPAEEVPQETSFIDDCVAMEAI